MNISETIREYIADSYRHAPVELDGWLCPRRSPLAIVERSRGFLHLWVGPFGLHLARPLHRSRLDFCADWWR